MMTPCDVLQEELGLGYHLGDPIRRIRILMGSISGSYFGKLSAL